MHHIAFERTLPHNRDLNNEVVESLGFQARQHVDLCTAFHLEHADAIALLQHCVDIRLFRRNIGERVVTLFMDKEQIERLADAGKHAECKNIHLHQAQRVEIVLVTFKEGAVVHRGSDDHTSELQSLILHSYAVLLLQTRKNINKS